MKWNGNIHYSHAAYSNECIFSKDILYNHID